MKSNTIIEQIAATAEILGQEISPAALALMAEDLAEYPMDEISHALNRVRRECHKLTLAGILERVPGGWMGAEEAWATFPKSEAETGVVTDEALQAWGKVADMWDSGDKIGARMAFKDVYSRLVGESKRKRPHYVASLGWDQAGREQAITAAVEDGRLPPERAKLYLPYVDFDQDGNKLSHEPSEGTQKLIQHLRGVMR